jgi:hypothetical protein
METCKIYTFDKDYSSEREDVEFQIGEMLNDGWKTKCISSVSGGYNNDTVFLTVIYEKEDKPKEKQGNID